MLNDVLLVGLLVSINNSPFSMVIGNVSKGRVAGAANTSPNLLNWEAWQGQLNPPVLAFVFTTHPRWVHFIDMAKKPPSSYRFKKNCPVKNGYSLSFSKESALPALN